jgi:hypothetical protein
LRATSISIRFFVISFIKKTDLPKATCRKLPRSIICLTMADDDMNAFSAAEKEALMRTLRTQMKEEAHRVRQALLNRIPNENDSDFSHYMETLKRRQLILQAYWRELQLQDPNAMPAAAPTEPIASQTIVISRGHSGGAPLNGGEA